MTARNRPRSAGPPPPQSEPSFAQQLREMNEALLVSLVRQHELTEQAQRAEEELREEERVRQRQLKLTKATRMSTVGELATGLAHELNQPLAAISNLVEACSRYVRVGRIDRAKLLDLLSDIADESMRAAAIVSHLRSFVDKGAAQIEPIDLVNIVSHVPHLLVRELNRHRITLRIDLPPRPLRVDADPIQVEQVIVNLLQNAMDSIEEADGPQRLIELSVRAVDGTAEVGVRDTGTAAPDAVAERMFEPFFTTKAYGLGMGLALSRSILEAHRGRIWMDRPADGSPGTIVRFSIPLKEPKRRRAVAAAKR